MGDSPIRILLIEDNTGDSRLILEMLKEVPPGSVELTTADRLDRGVESIRRGAPDVVLLDLGLPDSQGLATLHEASAVSPRTPIIVLTGLNDESIATQALGAGAQDYLVKGRINGDTLMRSVRYSIARQRDRYSLQESEARKRAILQAALDGIITIAHRGIVLEFNAAAEAMFGYRAAEAAGQELAELIIPPAYREQHRRALSNYLAGGQAKILGKRIELTACRRGGSEFPVELSVTRIGTQWPPTFTGFIRDITEHRTLYQQLADERARLVAAQAVAKVGSWETDLDTFLVDWSAETHNIFGTDPVRFQVTHERFLDLVHPGDRAEVNEAFFRSFEHARTSTIEHRLLLPDGQVKFVEERWKVSHDQAGKPVRASGTCQDITERKKMEHQFFRAQRLESIGTLAAGVAHDLNNTLAPIMMGVELLKMDYPQESDTVDMMASSARRAAGMVRQLLTFAKGAEGERILVSPSRLIGELEEMIRGSFPKNIEVRVHCETAIPGVMGDATQLHQVLMNLCVNARDAMPRGGTLTLEASSEAIDDANAGTLGAKAGAYVVLRVRDTGTGIPPELLHRIFDPFFSTKAPDKGTGLGLSTVVGIVKGHHGVLHVDSQLGKGTTFKVFLPTAEEMSYSEEGGAVAVSFRGQGETILLVDDEAAVREMGRIVLRRLNFNPVTATDGADGLIHAAMLRDELHAVITDLQMPHTDGLEFVRALRRMLPHVPVVVASGRLEEQVAAEFKSLNVTHRLDKPFTEGQLAHMLQRMLAPG
jgi:PAS domain S-box-containing protein